MTPPRKKKPKPKVKGKRGHGQTNRTTKQVLRRDSVAQGKSGIRTSKLGAKKKVRVKFSVSMKSTAKENLQLCPQFATDRAETKYMRLVYGKLVLTKQYIINEQKFNLDPNRPGMYKETTAMALCDGPIKIDLSNQQLVRLLLDEAKKLKVIQNAGSTINQETEDAMKDYWYFWTELRASLAHHVPGKDLTEKMDRMEKIMDSVLEKIVTDE